MLLWLQSNVLADVDMIIASLTSSLLVMVVLPQGALAAALSFFWLVYTWLYIWLVFYID